MVDELKARQLTGIDDSHLVALDSGHRLQEEVAESFAALQCDARAAGFELAIASSFRSFQRQLHFLNAMERGTRAVHDDSGQPVAILELPAREQMHAILRYSAIPGSSRHHWGTDLDVYDAAAMAPGYSLQLSPGEVASGGVFDPLHCWLDERMAAGQSHGFYRPYAADRGGVAPERWHLSYAPLSASCALQLSGDLLRSCWDWTEADEPLLLRDVIESDLQQIMARYVAVGKDWCPRG